MCDCVTEASIPSPRFMVTDRMRGATSEAGSDVGVGTNFRPRALKFLLRRRAGKTGTNIDEVSMPVFLFTDKCVWKCAHHHLHQSITQRFGTLFHVGCYTNVCFHADVFHLQASSRAA